MKHGPGLLQNSLAWQGLTLEEIDTALERPDQVAQLQFPELSPSTERPVITLYVKIRDDLEPPAYLLAIATKGHTDPDPELIDAWRVPRSWVKRDPMPHDILIAVCNQVGAKQECAGAEGKLLLQKHLAFIKEPPPLVTKEVPGGLLLYGHAIAAVRSDSDVFEIAIAYMMREDLVRQKLGPQAWKRAGS